MKGCRPLPLLAACVGAALCTLPSAPRGRGGEPAPPQPEVARLVRDLGSKSYEAREAATRRLLEWEAPPPELRAALKSGDAEVARRASRILGEITRREENAAFARLTEFARRGEADRLAELLVRRPKWADEGACWQSLLDLNGKLFDLESKVFGRTSFTVRPALVPAELGTAVKWRRRVAARRASVDLGHMDVRAEHIVVKTTELSYLVSTRSTLAQGVSMCMLVGGGTVKVRYLSCSVVVCAGDVECGSASRSLIIARGDVRLAESVSNCSIIAGGSVRFLPIEKPALRRRNNQVKEHEPNPLGFIKWFDPAQVGITVEAAAGGVRVKAAGKSFAAAGLRAGDLVVAIDGEAVKSPDDFRLLLRSKLADGGKMAFAVRRAGQDLKLPVRCKD